MSIEPGDKVRVTIECVVLSIVCGTAAVEWEDVNEAATGAAPFAAARTGDAHYLRLPLSALTLIEKAVKPLTVGDVVTYDERARLGTLPPNAAVKWTSAQMLCQETDWRNISVPGREIFFPARVVYIPDPT